jgi:Zonular occludens toxin (Zot).
MIEQDSWLHRFRQRRQAEGRDTKIIITSRNSTTGTGKTTLALWLAICWDQHSFDRSKMTLHVNEYLDRYLETKPGECLIMDEAEQVDARRSMSNKNIEFAEKWMQLRFRQVDSILTMPTISALDKRLRELADIIIHVTSRGTAKVHEINVGDYDGKVNQFAREILHWPDISDHGLKRSLDARKSARSKARSTRTEKSHNWSSRISTRSKRDERRPHQGVLRKKRVVAA